MSRPPIETVREVRVETRGAVDDIEVRLGDDSRRWMAVKERISSSSEEWKAVWRAFREKVGEAEVGRGDRLMLWLGSASTKQERVAEAARRAAGARGHAEWWSDLSKEQHAALEGIEDALGRRGDHAASFDLLRCVDVELVSRERLVDRVPFWIPAARGVTQHALYDVLQSKALEGARYRRTFTRGELLADLRTIGIDVLEPAQGVEAYRAALARETATMTIPGTALRGATKDVYYTPRMRIWHQPAARTDPRDLDDIVVDEGGEPVRIEDLPSGPGDRVVLSGGAGAGKSALVAALAQRYSTSTWVPAIVRLVDVANSGEAVTTFLDERLNRRYAAAVAWTTLCDDGVALLFFDGLDELPQALRTNALDKIAAFSARFPRTPWIMTVRDMAGTAAPPDARIVELKSLSPEDVAGFCGGWLPPDRTHIAAEIARKVSISRELRRMARIPFLLALMTEHAIAGDAVLPSRRSDLLERYVGVLLRPEKRKPGVVVDIDARTLRIAAEALAYAALHAGDTDLLAATASDAIGGASPQGVLDALVACGLLREGRGERYSFVFPILQEYLAGYHLATQRHDEIVGRFASEASRPWTQSLQFAVEVSDNAETLVKQLTSAADDAFRTNLKMLGRCIANGATVSAATRARIGDELAARWVEENREGTWTGELLADGWATSLPTTARERLQSGEQLECGGSAIVVAAGDPGLTESVLRAILNQGIPGHVNAWQAAIDQIAPKAASLYLGRARIAKTACPEREVHWLAYLLGRIADVGGVNDPRVAYAHEELGDPILRVACQVRLGRPLDEACTPLVLMSLRRYVAKETDGPSPALDLICDAMFRLPRRIEVWRASLELVKTTPLDAKAGAWWLFGLTPAEAYWRTLMLAIVPRLSADDAAKHVRDLAASPGLSQTQRDYLDLALAFLKDDVAFERLANRLDASHWRCVTKWIFLASSRASSAVAVGLSRLRHVHRDQRLEFATALGFAFSHEVDLMALTGGVRGVARRRHPAAYDAAKLLQSWADDAQPGSRERFACLAQAVNLGATDLAAGLLEQIVVRMDRPLDSETDHRMSDALTAVADAGVTISREVLARAARISGHNFGLRAYNQLERLRSSDALDELLALHAEGSGHLQRILAGHIERLARALAVRIAADASGRLTRMSAR